jgi:hypothetical protein
VCLKLKGSLALTLSQSCIYWPLPPPHFSHSAASHFLSRLFQTFCLHVIILYCLSHFVSIQNNFTKKNVTVVVKVLNVSLPCLFAGKWLSLGFSWWVFLQWSPPFMGTVEDGLTLMPPSTAGVTLPGRWVCTTSTGISSLLSL